MTTDPFPTTRRLTIDIDVWTATLARIGHDLADAVDGLRSWLDDLDGYPTRTLTDGLPRSTTDVLETLTSVERSAEARWLVSSHLAQLVDDHTAVGQLIDSYRHDLVRTRDLLVSATRLIADTTGRRLCDGSGFEGADLPWTKWSRNPDNGWFNPLCVDPADDSGLCDTCRPREARWRRRHGLQPRANNAPLPPAIHTREDQP